MNLPIRVSILSAAGLLLVSVIPMRAGTLSVTTASDSGTGSLRAAITAANNATGDDIIVFEITGAGPHIIDLFSALPLLATNIQIINDRPGDETITVQRSVWVGPTQFSIFVTTPGTTVLIGGLIVSNGDVAGAFPNDAGGGIRNDHAILEVRNCTLSANKASRGGAIFNDGEESGNASLTVRNSLIESNSSTVGGGIANSAASDGDATVTLIESTIRANAAPIGGGGIHNNGQFGGAAHVNLDRCTVSNNTASGGVGGGLFNQGAEGNASVSLQNSTLASNSANSAGGAVFNEQSNGVASVAFRNATISGNTAINEQSGISNYSGTLTLANTILKRGDNGENIHLSGGSVSSFGHNLSDDSAGGDGGTGPGGLLNGTGDIRNTDPQLDPLGLQDNGGPTRTIALRPGSPAIDKGTSNGPGGVLTTDQRGAGFPRTFDDPAIANAAGGDGTDIGAFEKPRGARGDFNRDGFADYLLFHPGTRRTAIWHLQGNVLLNGVYGPTLPSGWVVSAVADINLDGRPDYVLVNSNTRQTAIWYLNDGTVLGSVYGPTLPTGWSLIAAVDFNDNGKPDYVLFNASTGRTAFWFLNGAALNGSGYGPTLPAGWRPVDAQDFNSNGKPDLLLTNASTRQSAIWYLNGAVYTTGAYGPTLPSGWALQGTSDFSSDGKPDYVLLEASTRRTALWYLNGATFAGSSYGPTLSPGYSLVFP